MNKQPARFLTTRLAAFVAFFLVLALMVWGIPDPGKPTLRAGYFFLSTTASGISLYQPGKYAYYEFSPWNDYVLDSQGVRTAFLPADTAGQFHTILASGKFPKLLQFAKSAFGFFQPEVTFTGIYRMDYSVGKTQSGISVTRIVSDVPTQDIAATAHTMTYSRDDIVFDAKGMLYTENTDSDTEFLESYYNIPLTRHDTGIRRAETPATVYVINPRIAGVLAITSRDSETIWIDKDWKFIELLHKTYTDKSFTSTLNVNVLESPKDVRLEL